MLTLFAVSPVPNPLDTNPLPDAHGSNLFGLGLRDMLLIIGVAVALGLLLFIWAYLNHKTRRHHHSSDRLSKVITKAKKESPEVSASNRTKIRKKRRGHPDHLPRNPTLGETGGLPPIRPEDPPSEEVTQA